MVGTIRGLWQYRYFVLSSIRNELTVRFARSKLGALWMIINPLAQVVIYALILSNVLAAKLPDINNEYGYAIYLMAGLLAWNFFNEIVNRCLFLFIDQGNLIKKIHFPKITLPGIAIGSCLINNFLLFTTMLGVFFILGHSFTLAILWLIPLSLILCLFALGIGLILGIMNVFMRDIGQIMPIVLQFGFWFTPIVYTINIIPLKYHYLLSFNPMFYFTNAYQEIIVYGRVPQFSSIVIISVMALALMVAGILLFRRASEEMVDVL